MVLLVGAGVSVGAGVPAAGGVVNELRLRYPKKFVGIPSCDYSTAFDLALPGKENAAERRRLLSELCNGKIPGTEHRLIAHLVERRKVRTVLTLNFDHLTEIAFFSYCTVSPKVYLHEDDVEPKQFEDNHPKLLKLHGDFLFDNLANLEPELRARLNENMRERLLFYLENTCLLVIGYGGNDASIMEYLTQLAETGEGLSGGLWWSIHNEEALKNEKLIGLLKKMQDHGKPAVVIGPTDADDLLEELCMRTEIGVPKAKPFGIDSRRRGVLGFFTGGYGRSRQLPLVSEIAPSHEQSNQFKILLDAVSGPGTSWLVGQPGSGKSCLLAELLAGLGPQKVFYFNYRFSKSPVNLSLQIDLETFANSLAGSEGFGTSYEETVRWLLEHDTILVFDDLFPEQQEMPYDLEGMVWEAVEIQQSLSKGKIVLCTSRVPTNEELVRMYHKLLMHQEKEIITTRDRLVTARNDVSPRLRTNPVAQMRSLGGPMFTSFWPDSYRITPETFGFPVVTVEPSSLSWSFDSRRLAAIMAESESTRLTIERMGFLRLAEPLDFIARITGLPEVHTVMDRLVDEGMVEVRHHRYILREAVRLFCRSEEQASRSVSAHGEIGDIYDTVGSSTDTYGWSHSTAEAIYQYDAAGRNDRVLKLLPRMNRGIPEQWSDSFVYDMVMGAFAAWNTGQDVFEKLTEDDAINVLTYFVEIVWRRWHGDFEATMDVLRKTVLRLDKLYSERLFLLIIARLYQQSGSWQKAIEQLEKVELQLRDAGQTHSAVEIQLQISSTYLAHATLRASPWAEMDRVLLQKTIDLCDRALASVPKEEMYSEVALNLLNNKIAALASLREYQDAARVAEGASKAVQQFEALNPVKGMIFGNLFAINLELGKQDLAEGYFYESNLNYAYLGFWMQILNHLMTLLEFSSAQKKEIVPGRILYDQIMHSWYDLNVGPVKHQQDIPFRTVLQWFNHNISKQDQREVIRTFVDYLRLMIFLEFPADYVIGNGLTLASRIDWRFKKRSLDAKIVSIVRGLSPASYPYFKCWFDFVHSRSGSPDKFVIKNGVDPKWRRRMIELKKETKNPKSAALVQLTRIQM